MKWKKQSIELMKILSDPRRSRILHLAADEPVTVKQLADEMNEEPLRLYYHVNKLIQADLLEVVETRQNKNLTEKYYRSKNLKDHIYKSDAREESENLEIAIALLHRLVDPGMLLYQKSLEELRKLPPPEDGKMEFLPYHVSINSLSRRMTAKEWVNSLPFIMKAMDENNPDISDAGWPADLPRPEYGDEVGTYQYVLLSYRVEDAQNAGILDPLEPPDEQETAGENK